MQIRRRRYKNFRNLRFEEEREKEIGDLGAVTCSIYSTSATPITSWPRRRKAKYFSQKKKTTKKETKQTGVKEDSRGLDVWRTTEAQYRTETVSQN